MAGRNPLPNGLAKTSDHKVFITESEKAIVMMSNQLVGISGSEYIRESFIKNLKDLLNDNPELREHIEKELKKQDLEIPLYLKGGTNGQGS